MSYDPCEDYSGIALAACEFMAELGCIDGLCLEPIPTGPPVDDPYEGIDDSSITDL